MLILINHLLLDILKIRFRNYFQDLVKIFLQFKDFYQFQLINFIILLNRIPKQPKHSIIQKSNSLLSRFLHLKIELYSQVLTLHYYVRFHLNQIHFIILIFFILNLTLKSPMHQISPKLLQKNPFLISFKPLKIKPFLKAFFLIILIYSFHLIMFKLFLLPKSSKRLN